MQSATEIALPLSFYCYEKAELNSKKLLSTCLYASLQRCIKLAKVAFASFNLMPEPGKISGRSLIGNGMAVFGYIRVSTLSQAHDGDSLEAQKRQVMGYALSKGLELPEANVFVEFGVSGATEFEDRPAGSKLCAAMATGDLVVFPKLDRAFRNTRNALNVLHEFKARSVQAHFIDLGGDVTGTGVGAIVFTILSAFATFERERIAARIREVKQHQKAQGRFTGGRSAFGFHIVDGRKVRKADEQRVIEALAEMKSAGATYKQLSSWLQERHQKRLSPMGVYGILAAYSALAKQ